MKTGRGSVLFFCFAFSIQQTLAVTNYMYGGTYSSWPATWKPISSLNDPDDGLANDSFDIVGDNSDPAAYWHADPTYFYLRMRVDNGAPGSNLWGGSFFIMIDQVNTGSVGSLEYGLAWDYKENQQQNHGMELMVTNIVGNSWGGTRFFDVDGAQASKIAPPDFRLTGDGFIRTIEGQSTVNFGTSTYIDFAAAWSVLTNGTTLRPGQTWKIQLGTIDNANDHNWVGSDVAANRNPADIGLTWSDPITVSIPEPGTAALASIGLAAIVYAMRRRKKACF